MSNTQNQSERPFAPPPPMDFKLPLVNRHQVNYSPLNKNVAILLVVLGGSLGLHDFYLGYKSRGFTKLVLTLLVFTCFVSSIWAFVDFISLLTKKEFRDAQGRILS